MAGKGLRDVGSSDWHTTKTRFVTMRHSKQENPTATNSRPSPRNRVQYATYFALKDIVGGNSIEIFVPNDPVFVLGLGSYLVQMFEIEAKNNRKYDPTKGKA